MKYWNTLPPDQRMDLLKLYSSQGISYWDAIEDFEKSMEMYEQGNNDSQNYSNGTSQNYPVDEETLIKTKQVEMENLLNHVGQDPLMDLDIAVELERKNREINELTLLLQQKSNTFGYNKV